MRRRSPTAAATAALHQERRRIGSRIDPPPPRHPPCAEDGRADEAVEELRALRVRLRLERLDGGEDLRLEPRLVLAEVEDHLPVGDAAHERPEECDGGDGGGAEVEDGGGHRRAPGPPRPSLDEELDEDDRRDDGDRRVERPAEHRAEPPPPADGLDHGAEFPSLAPLEPSPHDPVSRLGSRYSHPTVRSSRLLR